MFSCRRIYISYNQESGNSHEKSSVLAWFRDKTCDMWSIRHQTIGYEPIQGISQTLKRQTLQLFTAIYILSSDRSHIPPGEKENHRLKSACYSRGYVILPRRKNPYSAFLSSQPEEHWWWWRCLNFLAVACCSGTNSVKFLGSQFLPHLFAHLERIDGATPIATFLGELHHLLSLRCNCWCFNMGFCKSEFGQFFKNFAQIIPSGSSKERALQNELRSGDIVRGSFGRIS